MHERFKRIESDTGLQEYKERRKELQRAIRRDKGGHKITFASRFKKKPKALYTYIKNMRIIKAKVRLVNAKGGNMCLGMGMEASY